MGTRNLTCVFEGGKYRVAQYGQWDGYPSGNGLKILDFLKTEFDPIALCENLHKCTEPTKKEIETMYRAVGAKGDLQWVNMEIADKFKAAHPSTSRDCGAGILSLIQKSPAGVPLALDLTFAGDSLMCEWAYVLDLDRDTFEVFSGFNKSPLAANERFVNMPVSDTAGEFYQIKQVASWPLRALPTEEEFLMEAKDLSEETEDEVA